MTAQVAMPPARRPFGELDTARWQALSSIKNRQNAIPLTLSPDVKSKMTYPAKSTWTSPKVKLKTAYTVKPTLTSPVKRARSPDLFDDDDDSENVDPSLFNSPSKRAKMSDGDVGSKSIFGLRKGDVISEYKPAFVSLSTPSYGRAESASLPTTLKAPYSPPFKPTTPAGRSPKSKRVGTLLKARTSSSSFLRVDPPSFLKRRAGVSLPFSLDAALKGTIPGYTPKTEPKPHAREKQMHASWYFDIYQDSPDEEMANLMEHSTCTLDISDDEGKRAEKNDRGKENIPPPDHQAQPAATNRPSNRLAVPVQHAAAAKARALQSSDDMILGDDVPRSPLGPLETSEFYPAGLDATSIEVFTDPTPGQATEEL